MTKYLAGVLSVIAAGVLLIAYGLLAPQASASFLAADRFAASQEMVPVMDASGQRFFVARDDIQMAAPVYASQRASLTAARPESVSLAPRAERLQVEPVREQSGLRRVQRSAVQQSRRDWKKVALFVGASTVTGAGVGGIINGKKGALIGAAIGGGASTIYQTTRR